MFNQRSKIQCSSYRSPPDAIATVTTVLKGHAIASRGSRDLPMAQNRSLAAIGGRDRGVSEVPLVLRRASAFSNISTNNISTDQ